MAKSIAAKEDRERTLAHIAATTLEEVEAAMRDRAEFGPGYGYEDPGDWWETQVRYFKLTDEEQAQVKPAFVTEWEQAKADDPVLAFVRDYDGGFAFLQSLKVQLVVQGKLTPKQYAAASKCRDREIEWQQAKAAKAAPKPMTKPVTAGMYRTSDGTIYKVQKAVHGSGQLYAKRLIPPDEFGGRATFEYERGAINKLTADDRMTLEEAKAFGALYGTCCVCGATLTDENSIEAGIGPICATKGEWA